MAPGKDALNATRSSLDGVEIAEVGHDDVRCPRSAHDVRGVDSSDEAADLHAEPGQSARDGQVGETGGVQYEDHER